MKPVIESQQLFKGALILTVAAMITKILSAVYRIPFQNIVGDVGFYIYQQVYPFYGMMLILATQGFPVVISKLYNEQYSKGNERAGQRMLVISFLFISILGLCLFCFFYLGSAWIARTMGDPQLSPLFRIIAFPFLIFPFTSCLRGYFQGKGNMIPTALSQVGEQLIRVMTILILSFIIVQSGQSLYIAGSGAVFGSVTGGLVGLFLLGVYFSKSTDIRMIKEARFRNILGDVRIVFKTIAIQGIAISISSMVLILMQLADALNLYQLLVSSGMTDSEAKVAKGVFDRGQPLIQLGTVVATSMALTLVPAISGRKDKRKIIKDVRIALQISLIVGSAAAIGLVSIIQPTNIMLFQNSEGSYILALLSIIILPGSILITVVGVLQGLNYIIYPAIMILVGFGLKYMLNSVLILKYGAMGAAVATVIAISTVLLLLIIKLRKVTNRSILSVKFIGKVFFAAGIMGVFLQLYQGLMKISLLYALPERLEASILAMTAVLFGAGLYLIMIIKMRLLGERELLILPFGSKLLFLLPKNTGDD